MGVTRLKRKDRMNKTVSRLWNQMIKIGTNKSKGSRAESSAISKQVDGNNAIIAQLEAKMAK